LREAGQLYTAWREGSRQVRERILEAPELFLKTQRQPQTPAATEAAALARDLEMAAAIVERANRRLGVALAEMNGERFEQAQQKIEQARRDLDRMSQRMKSALSTLATKEQEEQHNALSTLAPAEPTRTRGDSGTAREESEQKRARAGAENIAPNRTRRSPVQLHGRAEDPPHRESRTLPATDPRSLGPVQGESRASPLAQELKAH